MKTVREHSAHSRGFTLIELLVVVAIIAVLAASGFPSLREGVITNTMNKELRELRTGLNIARDTALTLSTTARLCAGNETGCTGLWGDGWIIFTDPDENGYASASSDQIIRVFSGLTQSVNEPTITLTPSTGNLGFDSRGFANAAASILLCYNTNDVLYGRLLNVSAAGVINASRDTDGDSIHNTGAHSQGANLTCP